MRSGGHAHAHDYGAHDHGAHGPGGHSHAPTEFGRVFAIAIALNVAIVVLQAGFGWYAGSVALLADAGHNLSDVLGLVVAYLASVLAARRPTERFTYGLGKASILAALFNAVALLVAVGVLSWEAVERLRAPLPVAGGVVMAVAALGAVLNGFTAFLLSSGGKRDLNVHGAFLHMVADAAVSAGVVVAAGLILLTGWLWLDPAASLLINAVIVWGTWRLLRESLGLALAGVPAGVPPAEVAAFLRGLPGVAGLHALHVWPLSTTETALTAHLSMPAGPPGDAFLAETADALKARWGIGHVTLQVETGTGDACSLAGLPAGRPAGSPPLSASLPEPPP